MSNIKCDIEGVFLKTRPELRQMCSICGKLPYNACKEPTKIIDGYQIKILVVRKMEATTQAL